MEDLDKKCVDLERSIESVEIKKQGLERQFDLQKKQLNEKISSLNDQISNEKETRDMWIERFEKEQKDHAKT